MNYQYCITKLCLTYKCPQDLAEQLAEVSRKGEDLDTESGATLRVTSRTPSGDCVEAELFSHRQLVAHLAFPSKDTCRLVYCRAWLKGDYDTVRLWDFKALPFIEETTKELDMELETVNLANIGLLTSMNVVNRVLYHVKDTENFDMAMNDDAVGDCDADTYVEYHRNVRMERTDLPVIYMCATKPPRQDLYDAASKIFDVCKDVSNYTVDEWSEDDSNVFVKICDFTREVNWQGKAWLSSTMLEAFNSRNVYCMEVAMNAKAFRELYSKIEASHEFLQGVFNCLNRDYGKICLFDRATTRCCYFVKKGTSKARTLAELAIWPTDDDFERMERQEAMRRCTQD